MPIYTSADALIGNTPLLRLEKTEKRLSLSASLYAKIESLNPAGSVKDRVAKAMIESAEAKGLLSPDTVIIEPTSGNTGIGLCAVGASRGYSVIIVMPDSMSKERRLLMEAFGAEVVLTPGAEGMQGAIRKAEELAAGFPSAWIPGQFDNPANPEVHYETTGPELYADLEGTPDVFVCGIGTGGTITGVGKYLKEKNPHCRIVGVEPASSPLLSAGKAGPHGLQGIGANFIPSVLERKLIDEVIPVTEEEAYSAGRLVGKTEGILVGISAGAAAHAAFTLASRPENAGKRIAVLFPDGGDRYLSTPMYAKKD
ncbi:MAG: cysteine synthase A [Clostridia bacterium]|nr:cysteine synthase A [Clostridia bacterium]